MQVTFIRWSMDPKSRTPVSINPDRVDCTEHFTDVFTPPPENAAYVEAMPAGTKIIMKGKQEYLVQGSLEEVVEKLNAEVAG